MGVCGVEMEVGGESLLSPESRPLFVKGDCVHVFEGTGSGLVKNRGVGWFGTVQGMREGKYLVRNRILVGRGEPAMIEGGYLTLQKDFGLGLGTGERTHFRTLSKRSRSRIEDSADRRNGSVLKEARKESTNLKTKMTTETEAHRARAEKTAAHGKAVGEQAQLDHKEQLVFWQNKCTRLETKKAQLVQQHKLALAKMVETHKQHEVSLTSHILSPLFPLRLPLFLFVRLGEV